MYIFVVFLRGINVSGQKKIKMAELIVHLKEVGLKNVTTYIQSGNLVISVSSSNKERWKQIISEAIQKNYGFLVEVFLLTPAELKHIINKNPFSKGLTKDISRTYVTLLNQPVDTDKIKSLNLENYAPEEVIFDNQTIYFYSPLSYGSAKMNNQFFERKLTCSATTRNWNTINKMAELCDAFL